LPQGKPVMMREHRPFCKLLTGKALRGAPVERMVIFRRFRRLALPVFLLTQEIFGCKVSVTLSTLHQGRLQEVKVERWARQWHARRHVWH
jgi:hypothetical protein